MSDVLDEAQQEFWQPPSPMMVEAPAEPSLADACSRCGAEFLLGSRFCHTCGERRMEAINLVARNDAAEMAGLWQNMISRMHSGMGRMNPARFWQKMDLSRISLPNIEAPSWLRYLHFHEIQRWVGLSTASLIAFVIGLGCVMGALAVGFITAKTLVDWQAIQIYRMEWLLAATVAFVAGILLKRPADHDRD
jgi:hypothetical protein